MLLLGIALLQLLHLNIQPSQLLLQRLQCAELGIAAQLGLHPAAAALLVWAPATLQGIAAHSCLSNVDAKEHTNVGALQQQLRASSRLHGKIVQHLTLHLAHLPEATPSERRARPG